MTSKQFIKLIEQRKKAIAAERDKLRAMIDDLEDLDTKCRDAQDSIDDAVSALSELV